MKKIRLCLISHLYPVSHSDYKGVFVRDLAAALVQKGVDVHVVTPMRPGAVTYECTDGIHINRFVFWGWKKGLQLGQLKGLPVIMLGSLVMAGMVHLLRLSFQHKPDLFHAYWIVPGGFMAAAAGILTRKPVVATAAGSDLNIAAVNKFIAMCAFFTFTQLAALISVSRPLMNKAIDMGMAQSKTVYIPGPVGINMQKYSTPACTFPRASDPLGLIYVGNLESPKRVDTLIRAAGQLQAKGVNFTLTIAGSGPLKERLKQLSRDNGVTDRVIFTGRIPHERVPHLLQSSHVFWHSSENEGLPVAIMEAMAAGLPVIAAGVGGIPELVKHDTTGFCLPYDNDTGFAAKTLVLYHQDKVRMKMGLQARLLVDRQFNKEHIIQQNLDLYRKVLKRKEQ